MKTLRYALVAACVAGAVVVLPAQQARSFLVTVTDDAHKPVTGLGAEDFAIKDGGARQPVISAEPATGPLAVDILVTEWMEVATPTKVERAAAELIHGADAANTVQAPYLTVEGPYGMTPFATPPPPPDPRKYALSVTDGVFDRAPILGGTSADRRALLMIVNAPATLREYAAHSASDLLSRLRAAKTSLWVVDLAPIETVQNDELDALIAASGGLHLSVKDGASLSEAARSAATLLTTSQYIVTANVAAMATGPLPLATRHDRGIVLIPIWSR
jgi:hypothetical protein